MRVAGVAERLLELSARDPLSEEIGRHLWVRDMHERDLTAANALLK